MRIQLFLTVSISYYKNQKKYKSKSRQPNMTVILQPFNLLTKVFNNPQHNYLGRFHKSAPNSCGGIFSSISELFEYSLTRVFSALICTRPEVTFSLLLESIQKPHFFSSLKCFSPSLLTRREVLSELLFSYMTFMAY